MVTELLGRSEIDSRDGSPVSLIQNPELFCRLRDAIKHSVCDQFANDPSLQKVYFNSWSDEDTPLQRIFDEGSSYDGVYWPRRFEIRIVRDTARVTVSYDDWSVNNEPVVIYDANLL